MVTGCGKSNIMKLEDTFDMCYYDYIKIGIQILELYTKIIERYDFMRRRDREITDKQDILEVMRKCDVCRIALHDGDYPYIVPLNFGLQVENDMPVLLSKWTVDIS